MYGMPGLLVGEAAAVLYSPAAAFRWFCVVVVRREGQPVPPPTGAALAEEGQEAIEEGFRRGGRLVDVGGLISCVDGRQLDAHRPDGAAGAAGIHKACLLLGLVAATGATAPGASVRSVMGAAGLGPSIFKYPHGLSRGAGARRKT